MVRREVSAAVRRDCCAGVTASMGGGERWAKVARRREACWAAAVSRVGVGEGVGCRCSQLWWSCGLGCSTYRAQPEQRWQLAW